MTDAQAEELDQRLRSHEPSPQEGASWQAIRDRLQNKVYDVALTNANPAALPVDLPGGSMKSMKVLTAKVVGGKIDVTGDLEEGATVAVFGVSSEEPRLTVEDETELAQALAEIQRGQFIDGQQLVAELKARTKA